MEVFKVITFILQRLLWLPVRLLLMIFCSLEISGIENIKNVKSNVIIASNHSSEIDPIIVAASLTFFSRHLPIFFVSLEKNFYKSFGWKKNIYGGLFFKLWGAYPAYPGLKNYEQALRNHLKLIRTGKTISIFPSGKRVKEGESVKARGGVSFLASATSLPIIPMLIKGTEKITVSNFFSRKRKIKVIFGPPIYPKDMFPDQKQLIINDHRNDYEAASEIIMEKISRL